ncbi:hypothetical protein EV361DRAFT_954102 [Lentinula raphanica]|nr:hypothetical protein EV361DRAFT_954102 [Lentinula raphanica]
MVRASGRKNRNRVIAVTGGDPQAPTDSEFKVLAKFQKFIITANALNEEDQDVSHAFQVGDCVSILPSDLPNGSGVEGGPAPPIQAMWLGIIHEIRMRIKNGEEEAWIRVQWLYSKSDVEEILPKFDITHLGEHERLLSDHFDIVHSATLDDVVPISRLHFDPYHEGLTHNSSSLSVEARKAALKQILNQATIFAANSTRRSGSVYPDIYYRYNFKVQSKRIFPTISPSACLNPNRSSKRSHARSSQPNRRYSSTASGSTQTNVEICLSTSSYSPPDSEQARAIGRQVAVLVRKAHSIIEDGVNQILQSLSRSESQPNPTPTSVKRRVTRRNTLSTQTATPDADSGISPESFSLSTQDTEVLLNTAKSLATKIQEVVLLEDSLAMHICPQVRESCGKAWHRSCLIRDRSINDEVAEGGISDDIDNLVREAEASSHLERWFRRQTGVRQARPTSPSFQHIVSQWRAASPSVQQEVQRMLHLLSTAPPGYERESGIDSEGKYQFPVLQNNAGSTGIMEASPRDMSTAVARGKRKARLSEQEELEVMEDLLSAGGTSNTQQTRTIHLTPRHESAKVIDLSSDRISRSPKKQRRSIHFIDSIEITEPANVNSAPRPTNDDADEEDHIPRILYSLSSLRAPELVCLASQPLVRGGLPPISLPARFTDSLAFVGTSPILGSMCPLGRALQNTVTGNIARVAEARIMIYETLDKMSLSSGDVALPDMVVEDDWADHVVELEGRDWFFELFNDSANPSNRKAQIHFTDSREKIRQMVLSRTQNLLRLWQARRQTVMLCPSCKSDI